MPPDHRQAGRTHIVTNQPPPLAGHDVLTSDVALVEAVERYGGTGAAAALSSLGRLAGSEQALRWGADANAYPPVLRTHDRYGHRVDEVDFHPSWHELMRVAIGHGLHAAPWDSPAPDAHLRRCRRCKRARRGENDHGAVISVARPRRRRLG